jgi:hypothetical protein
MTVVQAQILINTHESFDENFGCGHEEALEIMDTCVAQSICLPMTRAQAKIEALQSLADGVNTTIANYEARPRSKRGKKRKTVLKTTTVSKTAISSAHGEERDTTSSAQGNRTKNATSLGQQPADS